jgi:exonuclease SbcC
MKLTSLTMSNFRCFESVELDLNVDGLIGVVGPNGAGKSSLFAAVDWALFGSERGPSSLPAHRDGTEKKDCRVEVEFLLGEQHFRVTRTPGSAELWLLDSQTRLAKGTTATSAAAVSSLGMSRDSFLSTFYARQREVQALDPRDAGRRRGQLERLLGIERLRRAAELARAQSREQELIIKARQANAPDPKEALAGLRETEDQARLRAPAVDAAKMALVQADERRARAREALEAVQHQAEREQNAAAAVKLAAAEAREAAKDTERATKAAIDAAKAQDRLAEIAPLAARCEELRARERELDLRRQAAERAKATRARWQAAQSSATRLREAIAEAPDEREALEHRQRDMQSTREALQIATTRSIEVVEQLGKLESEQREADRRVNDATRIAGLDTTLAGKADVAKKAETAAITLTSVQAEILEVERHLGEESANLEAIRRDGPDAQCLRCRRPYGDDFQAILGGLAEQVTGLQRRQKALVRTLREARTARTTADSQLAELTALQRERDALGTTGDLELLRGNAGVLTARREAIAAERARLQADREAADAHLSQLQKEIEPIAKRVDTWQRKAQELEAASRDAELLAAEMASAPSDAYHPSSHEEVRTELELAQAAEQETASLRSLVDQLTVLRTRASQAAQRAQETQANHDRLVLEAQEVAIGKAAVSAAKKEDLHAEQARTSAGDALHAAEQEAIREDEAVKRAREALERARQTARQLRTERGELATRKRIQELLEAYRSHASRHALPDLERDTAALLAAVTRGRYSDVRISDTYALEVNDAGQTHSLRRFSGGEQDITNLCLRLALSRALARQRGIDAGFVILDEVLGSQDQDRRAVLMDELRELTREFRQVFVVSHFTDIVDSCDIHLRLSRAEPPAPARVARG